jgi:V/A-type H+/Na+-transporting ATPase subunit E
MAQTIETFIDRLQADGVEAGREAAAKIRAEAEAEARKIIEQAEQQARRRLAEAETEAEQMRARTETELRLAARDAVRGLQESIERALRAVLTGAVRKKLDDSDFLAELLREVVRRYVEADQEGRSTIEINVSEPMRRRLVDWAIQTFHGDIEALRGHVDLHGTLAGPGFEFTVADGTVEVTVESVVEVLAGLVGPEVRRLMAEAAGNGQPAT